MMMMKRCYLAPGICNGMCQALRSITRRMAAWMLPTRMNATKSQGAQRVQIRADSYLSEPRGAESPIPAAADPTAVELEPQLGLAVPAQVALKRRAPAPAQHRAPGRLPWSHDDVDPSMRSGLASGWIPPHDHSLVQRVEPGSLPPLAPPRQRRLAAVAVPRRQREGVRDVLRLLEADEDLADEVKRRRGVDVAQYHVHVPALRVATPVPSHDGHLEPGVDLAGVGEDDLAYGLDLDPRYLQLELVVVFHSDLLDAA
ncbi:unnamed protein product [Clonostachys rosea]|uniref:Uncharacterized protein n=1 Tax=Bionectria ochroleuca TaxID=29856 RepID=A0ABY6URT2_BIOOC|nr:unnamed protein product [Clonostachys rosea]